ncbi:MAG: hypothetical protein R3E39_31965 [Anaerolineae bacterium]
MLQYLPFSRRRRYGNIVAALAGGKTGAKRCNDKFDGREHGRQALQCHKCSGWLAHICRVVVLCLFGGKTGARRCNNTVWIRWLVKGK